MRTVALETTVGGLPDTRRSVASRSSSQCLAEGLYDWRTTLAPAIERSNSTLARRRCAESLRTLTRGRTRTVSCELRSLPTLAQKTVRLWGRNRTIHPPSEFAKSLGPDVGENA
jgi:hypothetical protein